MNNAYISYCASKKEGEKAMWDFMEKEKPRFTLTVFLPPLIFGPPIQKVKTMKHINFSTDQFYNLFNGSNAVTPGTVFPAYVCAH
jgi:nucleoside-diphosphate-sugar epimerase